LDVSRQKDRGFDVNSGENALIGGVISGGKEQFLQTWLQQ